MQAKRIIIAEGNDGVSGDTGASITVSTDPREEVNFHNIIGYVSVEPQDTDANAQGTWALRIIRENQTPATLTDVVVNGETHNQSIIAIGIWSCSNQSPFNSGIIRIKTSRTLQPGDILQLVSVVTGITAGLASNRVLLFAHTVRK